MRIPIATPLLGQQSNHEVDGGQHEEQCIEAIEHSAVAGQHAAHVLDAQITFHERLGQITNGRNNRSCDRNQRRVHRAELMSKECEVGVERVDPDNAHDGDTNRDGCSHATEESLDGLVRARVAQR